MNYEFCKYISREGFVVLSLHTTHLLVLYLEKHVLKITFTWKQRDFIKDNHKKVFCASRKNPAYKLTKLSQIKLNIETGTEKNLHPHLTWNEISRI